MTMSHLAGVSLHLKAPDVALRTLQKPSYFHVGSLEMSSGPPSRIDETGQECIQVVQNDLGVLNQVIEGLEEPVSVAIQPRQGSSPQQRPVRPQAPSQAPAPTRQRSNRGSKHKHVSAHAKGDKR